MTEDNIRKFPKVVADNMEVVKSDIDPSKYYVIINIGQYFNQRCYQFFVWH